MTKNTLTELSQRFSKFTIAVVGDVFLDKYTHGLVRGTSKETPVPLFELEHRIVAPGAAGNVASNFASLGAAVHLVGFIGDDDDGHTLKKTLRERKVNADGLICIPTVPTNSYEKIIARAPNGRSQELLLIQTRMPDDAAVKKARGKVLPTLKRLSRRLDAVIVVDQVSHFCTKALIAKVSDFCRKKCLLSVGNSRYQIHFYKGLDLIVVNELEAAQATRMLPTPQNFMRLGKALLPRVRKAVLLTTGPDGMRLFEKNTAPLHHPAVAREIVDITGAGDTALAAYVCARLSNLPPRDALLFGNAAAAVAIAKPGTATASLHEIAHYL